jgi:hypothetical protein
LDGATAAGYTDPVRLAIVGAGRLRLVVPRGRERQHADTILARLTAGSMTSDGAWPAELITVFEGWIAAGAPP